MTLLTCPICNLFSVTHVRR